MGRTLKRGRDSKPFRRACFALSARKCGTAPKWGRAFEAESKRDGVTKNGDGAASAGRHFSRPAETERENDGPRLDGDSARFSGAERENFVSAEIDNPASGNGVAVTEFRLRPDIFAKTH